MTMTSHQITNAQQLVLLVRLFIDKQIAKEVETGSRELKSFSKINATLCFLINFVLAQGSD